MKNAEAANVFNAAVGAHTRTHNERPFCIHIGCGLAKALITDDETGCAPKAFKGKGISLFDEEMFEGYAVNVDRDLSDDFAILTFTKQEWDKSQNR